MLRHLKMSVNRASTEHKQCVTNFGCCIWHNPRAKLRCISIIEAIATCIGNVVNVDVNTQHHWHQHSVKAASTECQQSINRASTEHQQSINDFGCCILYNPWAVLLCLPIIKVLAAFRGIMVSVNVTTPEDKRQQSINRARTILGVASCIIQGLCYGIYP
jgi:hypothetical protein